MSVKSFIAIAEALLEKKRRLFHVIVHSLFVLATQNIDSAFAIQPDDTELTEAPPVAFKSSYVGLLINQNHPYSFGLQEYSAGGPSWGVEYRFFFKDTWSLAISGSFKQLEASDRSSAPIFSLSQETVRLVRLYHPWYLGIGARLQYFVPVKEIVLPYERDNARAIDNGAAVVTALIWQSSDDTALVVSANRWTSLNTSKRQGIEFSVSGLVALW
jgi:hypothetical protein